MDPILPPRLHPGSTVRVITPACSRTMVTEGNENAVIAERHLRDLGLRVTFGEHVDEDDRHHSSPVASRLADLHAAFADPGVDAVLTAIGGFNSNELLPQVDFDLIRRNPKILCGYSDITALQNAITARTGLVTYSGPHWSTFGMRDLGEQTRTWFRSMLTTSAPVTVTPAPFFTDDAWFSDQDHRTPQSTDGWWVLRPGTASGRIVGGNLCTLNLLQGTPNMPSLEDAVLMIEDDETSTAMDFRRNLHSLLQLPGAQSVRALVIGRFQQASGVTREELEYLIDTLPWLDGIPVVAHADFGHTNPLMTFPIGGQVQVRADPEAPALTFTVH